MHVFAIVFKGVLTMWRISFYAEDASFRTVELTLNQSELVQKESIFNELYIRIYFTKRDEKIDEKTTGKMLHFFAFHPHTFYTWNLFLFFGIQKFSRETNFTCLLHWILINKTVDSNFFFKIIFRWNPKEIFISISNTGGIQYYFHFDSLFSKFFCLKNW